MPQFYVSKSVQIEAPPATVYAALRDFRQWESWSPWLIAEPEAVVTYHENPDGYDWKGEVTGEGQLHVMVEDAPHRMRCKLEFIKPWKSVCETAFSCEPLDGGTQVTWTMDSSLPFFMFFMTKLMTAMIGSDYTRGLLLLKDHIELGEAPSKLSFPGPTSFSGGLYVGTKAEGSTEEISSLAQASLTRLHAWREETGTQLRAKPFAIYHQWDLVKKRVSFTTGFPIEAVPESLPDELFVARLPDVQVYPVRHVGPYRHIANAWSAGIMHGRSKKFRPTKQPHAFEVYETMPSDVEHENEIVTVVNFPIK